MLAWMDLEMTGLDPDRHVIVEIATLLTDDELEIIAEGPDLIPAHPDLDSLNADLGNVDDDLDNEHLFSRDDDSDADSSEMGDWDDMPANVYPDAQDMIDENNIE